MTKEQVQKLEHLKQFHEYGEAGLFERRMEAHIKFHETLMEQFA